MAECSYCELATKKESIVFEDNDMAVVMAARPAAKGHMMVIPKQHVPILEQAPKGLAGKLFLVANKMSALAFQVLGAQGTNIILENGVPAGQIIPHLAVHVLPRKKDDGLKLEWAPKKATEEDLGSAEERLKAHVGEPELAEEKPRKKEAPERIVADKNKEDYLLKQLERMP